MYCLGYPGIMFSNFVLFDRAMRCICCLLTDIYRAFVGWPILHIGCNPIRRFQQTSVNADVSNLVAYGS